jgi:glycosyltransferase involved in cell wall biosynthesis
MVVIPARNEEASIARAVKSFPPDTVIVVDDDSSDATADEARKAGAGVLPAPPLPVSALGKSQACMVGARVLTSRWILFADADTWYQTGFVDSAVAGAEAGGLDLLSIHLTPAPRSLAEHVLVPYLSALFFSGASLRGSPAILFSGRCLLVRREAYEFVGGHAPVLEHLAEDVKLAALAQRHRLRFSVARAGNLGYVRLYDGWRGIWAGIERDASRVALVSHRIGVVILLTAAWAALWIPAVIWLWIDDQRAAAGAFALMLLVLLGPWYGVARVLLAPMAIYAAIPFLLHGLLRSLSSRAIAWKGRQNRD